MSRVSVPRRRLPEPITGRETMLHCDSGRVRVADACGCLAPHPCGPSLGRRGFLGGGVALGAAFAAPAVLAQGAPTRIDVHHHYTSPALLAMMKGRRTHQTFNEEWTVTKSLDAMDKGGVATAVVSTSDPGVWFGDFDAAAGLARDCNEYQARLVADHPRPVRHVHDPAAARCRHGAARGRLRARRAEGGRRRRDDQLRRKVSGRPGPSHR